MTDWIKCISDLMDEINAQWDAAKRTINKQLGIQDPIHIMPYCGYGTPQKIYLKGRVLQDEGIALREEDAPVWKNLLNMYRRFETDEVPGVPVRIHVGEQQQDVTTNDEGFFNIEIELEPNWTNCDRILQPVQMELLTDEYPTMSDSTEGNVLVVSDQAEFGVISDIDDTIMHTAATDVLKMIQIAYLGNAQTRRPFNGVPEFYQMLQQGRTGKAGNPIFYVSSSAWNMYDVFAKFMELSDVPKGPILLRDIELSPANLLNFDHESHKRELIRPILEQFSELRFILIGDTGQKDAEIYHQLAQNYPGRIMAIYLRNVTPDNKERLQQWEALGESLKAQGIEYLIFSDTLTLVNHATNQGWIT
ncbi:MAG: App1 family protein [Thainema sp.]